MGGTYDSRRSPIRWAAAAILDLFMGLSTVKSSLAGGIVCLIMSVMTLTSAFGAGPVDGVRLRRSPVQERPSSSPKSRSSAQFVSERILPAFRTQRDRYPLFNIPSFRDRRPAFDLRLVVVSGDEPIQLIEAASTEEEKVSSEAPSFEPSTIDEPEDDAELPKPLSDVAVSIDGAADKATKDSKEEEIKIAGSRFSIGGLIGDGDKLGILELIGGTALPTTLIEEGSSSRFDLNFGYAIRWLTGPVSTDLPPQLFTMQIDVGWAFHLNRNLVFDTRITPTWNTDFEKSTDIFRLPWHALAIRRLSPSWQWTMGVTDLDREDIQLLPVVGATYAPPDGDVVIDLVFPRPKVARRISKSDHDQSWFYLAGELGGGSWGINRLSGSRDIVTLHDLRLLVGLETTSPKGHSTRLEAGWVFDRKVEYRSRVGDFEPSDTMVIRWVSDY